MKILLAEDTAPPKPGSAVAEIPPAEEVSELPHPEPNAPPRRPARLEPVKNLVKQGYFDPTRAFESTVDWKRFRKAQISLFLLSLLAPFLTLLLLGFLLGVVYLTGASLYSATSPNPIYQLMLYPLVFVVARGYWLAYLALPFGLFAIGWLWAAATAWSISRLEEGTLIDFKKALSILAMLGAMLAPFTLFPFLRLLALAVILWFIVRRLEDTFDIGFWPMVGRGGLILLASVFLYGAFERKVESYFPAGEELRTNLQAFIKQKKMLEWPSFQAKVYINPNERLYADLSDFSPQVREPATQKALAMLKAGGDTPSFRFRLASRLAECGQVDAFLFLSRYYATGQGIQADPSAALDWIQRFTDARPDHLEGGLDRARLLLSNNRQLEGKRYLVGIAKRQITTLGKVTAFIQKEGLGSVDSALNTEVLSLYQFGNTTTQVAVYNSNSSFSRYGYETQTKQEDLLKRLYVNEHDQTLWFYRALVSEYSSSTPAGSAVYGEASSVYGQAELDQKILEEDPVAMDIAADRCASRGDLAKARQLWLSATRVLNSDHRSANVPYYLKLAGSFDPEGSTKAPDPHEATKYYLAALLISSWQGRGSAVGMQSLQRLQPGKVPDPKEQAFLDLCLKYEIPEAWAMMGDRYLNGDFPGVPRNQAKGRDCFLKAQALGYKGPQFSQQLALLAPSGAPTIRQAH
ncbi:hypothetical protein [Geothrix paludis]|uniref:hypothetical protein n=1 Tax=Geothrix paludis TaxID=2922722 RepID=UPI001FAE4542|nr:hypothetical protein [Geothrix paludis]